MSKYRDAWQTSDEIMHILETISGDTECDHKDPSEELKCKFCQIWSNPTKKQIQKINVELKKLNPAIFPLYWGSSTILREGVDA